MFGEDQSWVIKTQQMDGKMYKLQNGGKNKGQIYPHEAYGC